MVAVGNLRKIWNEVPLYVTEEEFGKAFDEYFGAGRKEVLDAVDMSFAYNAYNTVYFSVGDIKTISNMNLDQLLKENGLYQPPNVVVS